MSSVLFLVVVLAISSLALASSGRITIVKLVSEEDVDMALANYTANLSEKSIKDKGSFSIVLSAGGTLIYTLSHIASLFPNRPQRYEKKRWVTYITDSPKPPPPRITLTFLVINSAAYIGMVVTDKEEANAVHVAIDHIVVSPTLPCAEVTVAEELTWLLDKDAASKLDGCDNNICLL
ncbi:hypothetical protein BUALT_Bualt06G0085500 [Buddleja alternifolia]|uniref:Glucosamine/galactosamine-6-phosphate isomerase domain-containing protein n=1 Tax=Buddleja alternifolia TaxID=168488 RepID=A0AAV6XF25_9LAMI|nr:hypothetical protein BUALT_Bualt06G0085500 [Buddleja alternifolia]